MREYFLSADTAEVATALAELDQPDMHHIFVKQVTPTLSSCMKQLQSCARSSCKVM